MWFLNRNMPSLYQVLNRGQGGGTTSTSYEPVFLAFTSLSEITVTHAFPSKYVTVTLYTTADFTMPPERVKAIKISSGSVRIAFHAAESGMAKITY